MYWAVKAKQMNVWISYGKYLPQNLSELAFYLGIILGSLLILLFVLGILLVTRAKHCIISCPYASLTFVSFIAYYLMGILCLAAGFYGAEAVQDYCLGQDLDYWMKFKLYSYVTKIDNTYIELDKQLMCTDICPCLPISQAKLFTNQSLALRKFDSLKGANNLDKCLADINYQDKWDYQVINYLRDLEKSYNCTGLCKPQTFHLFTSYQTGPNTEPCFHRIADELERDMGKMGYVFLSCGTFVFCAWFC